MAGICQRAVLTLVLALPFFLSFLPITGIFLLLFIFFFAYYHLDSASKRVKSLAGFDDSYYLVAFLLRA